MKRANSAKSMARGILQQWNNFPLLPQSRPP